MRTRGNVQAGADIEFAGTVETQSMTYNTGVAHFYGLLLTRRSHNVTVANNTEAYNFINFDIQGEYGGGETAIGMVGIIQNNICSEKVMNAYGTSLVVRWEAENNTSGEGTGYLFSNNALGAEGAGNGGFAMWGNNQIISTYAALDVLYSSHSHGSSAAWYSAPITFVNTSALNFDLVLPTANSNVTNASVVVTAAKRSTSGLSHLSRNNTDPAARKGWLRPPLLFLMLS